MKFCLPIIHHDFDGFRYLAELHAQTKDLAFEDIVIDMVSTTWFDGDMSAVLGALLYKLGAELNTMKLVNIRTNVEEILSRNGFLTYYGREKLPDSWGTTIPYKRFDVQDDRHFATYVEDEFIKRAELPLMSHALLKKFSESIFEIFNNAVTHSMSELGIFSCGQFYPRRDRLNFTIVDLGVGIPRNVSKIENTPSVHEEAIEWATMKYNTTKFGVVPGGLGLKLLVDFIDFNRGTLKIVSDTGFWQRLNGKTIKENLHFSFPGTVVNIEIDTKDTKRYILR